MQYDELKSGVADPQKARVWAALESTFNHFDIPPVNRPLLAESLLKMETLEKNSRFDGDDDRIQVLLQMFRYFQKIIAGK
jgi:hypothetical protein